MIVEVYLAKYHKCHRLVITDFLTDYFIQINCVRFFMWYVLSFNVRTVKSSNGGLVLDSLVVDI